MPTVISETGEHRLADAKAEGDALWLSPSALDTALGWTQKPEGLCQGEVCVPLQGRAQSLAKDGRIDAAGFWRHLGRPAVSDRAGTLWVFGAGAAERGQRLASLEAPDFALPDLAGRSHRLSDQRGKKVFLATWASW
jgi:hypothetical protein